MELSTLTKTHPTEKGLACQGLEEGQSSASSADTIHNTQCHSIFLPGVGLKNAAVELILAGRGMGWTRPSVSRRLPPHPPPPPSTPSRPALPGLKMQNPTRLFPKDFNPGSK